MLIKKNKKKRAWKAACFKQINFVSSPPLKTIRALSLLDHPNIDNFGPFWCPFFFFFWKCQTSTKEMLLLVNILGYWHLTHLDLLLYVSKGICSAHVSFLLNTYNIQPHLHIRLQALIGAQGLLNLFSGYDNHLWKKNVMTTLDESRI